MAETGEEKKKLAAKTKIFRFSKKRIRFVA